MKDITRIENPKLVKHLEAPEVTLLTGSRQVGKTTLMRQIQDKLQGQGKTFFHFNLEFENYLNAFNENPLHLFDFVPTKKGSKTIVFIDEIQYLKNPSNFLKLLYDEYKTDIKLVVTGSSAFYIDEKFKDSLAGRKRLFHIKPISFAEFILYKKGKDYFSYLAKGLNPKNSIPQVYATEMEDLFDEYLVFGGYPAVVKTDDVQEKIDILIEISTSYVQKDLFDNGVRKSNEFRMMLELIASQCCGQLNVNDLSKMVKATVPTINNYLHLLEKSFHITQVKPFFNNYSKELVKMPKLFFQDNGFRNALLNNFSRLITRDDKGTLLENQTLQQLLVHYREQDIKYWRTTEQNEVDFILKDKKALEIKFKQEEFKESKYKLFRSVYEEYPLLVASFKKEKNKLSVWEI
ncbi:ATP-binding protein [Aurantibacillus circumpalustris]|uniref:ATP-binding protein n=1 Tax=Aurantibacillus circumpalustris TaxID=3036359 RepID=UPI00295BE462|nr:ATP-binding protein [Aurantibacillus circumpalustris]